MVIWRGLYFCGIVSEKFTKLTETHGCNSLQGETSHFHFPSPSPSVPFVLLEKAFRSILEHAAWRRLLAGSIRRHLQIATPLAMVKALAAAPVAMYGHTSEPSASTSSLVDANIGKFGVGYAQRIHLAHLTPDGEIKPANRTLFALFPTL